MWYVFSNLKRFGRNILISIFAVAAVGCTNGSLNVQGLLNSVIPSFGLNISNPSLTNVNSTATVTYSVNYILAASVTLVPANVSLSTTGTANCTVASVTGSNPTMTVTLNNCTGDGTVAINIASGTATDSQLNLAPASGPSAAFTVDNTPPTVNISAGPSLTDANGTSTVTYTLTYSGANATTLVPGNVTLNTTGGASCSVGVTAAIPTSTVTLTGCTGNGTVGITVVAGTASDLAGNLATASGVSGTFNVDTTPPTLNISAGPSLANANGSSTITYTLTYGGATATILVPGNILLNTTGGASCTVGVTALLPNSTVTLTGCTGNGTVGISVAAGTASDAAGNLAPAAGPSATFNVDTTPPSLNISAGPSLTDANNTSTITYTLTYGGATATTLVPANITLNTTGGASCTVGVTALLPNSTVTLTGCTGNGTVGINVVPGTASDAAGNLAPAAGPSATFNVDTTPPSLSISAPSLGTANSASTVTYTLTYGGASATTLVPANITLNTTGGATCTVGVTAALPNSTVTLTNCTGNGTVGISVVANTASDVAGNQAPAAGPSGTFIVNNTGPSLSISAGPSLADANSASTVTYTLNYVGATTISLVPANITLNATGGATCTVGVTALLPNSTVTLTNCTGNGTVGISVVANTAADALLNQANAAGPSATFNVDNTAPTLSISAGPSIANANSASSVTYTLTYGGATATTLIPGNISLSTTGSANCIIGVSAAIPTSTVTLTGCGGDGTVGISVVANTASDAAGNQAPAAGPSATFVVDNTLPAVTCAAPAGNAQGFGWYQNSDLPLDLSTAMTCADGAGSGCNAPSKLCAYAADGVTFGGFGACSQVWAESSTVAGSKFKIQEADLAGNVGVSAPCTVNVDLTTPPVPTFSAQPPLNDSNTSPSFQFSSTDVLSGTQGTYQCKIDGGGYGPCTSPYATGILVSGAHTFTVYATDKAGNTSGLASYTWTIDATAPNCTISTPIAASWSLTSSPSVTFTCTDNSGAILPAAVQCQLDGGGWGACSGYAGYSYAYPNGSFTLSGLSDGAHTIAVKAADAAGNMSLPASSAFSVDASPPAVNCASIPGNGYGWINNPSIDFSSGYTCADGGGSGCNLVTMQCNYDPGSGPLGWGACTSGSWPNSTTGAGSTFQIKITDNAGNVGTSGICTVKLDSTPPAAPPSFTVPSATVYQSSNTIAGTVNPGADALSGLDGANTYWGTVYSNGACTISVQGPFASSTTNINLGGAPGDGVYYLGVKALDKAGNYSSETCSLFPIIVDSISPNFTTAAAITGTPNVPSGSTQTITWSVNDANMLPSPIFIDYSTTTAGGPWNNIAVGTVNSGSYSWTVPVGPFASVWVRVSAKDMANNIQSSITGSFAITAGGLNNFSVTGPANINADDCVGYTVTRNDSGMVPITVGTDVAALSLSPVSGFLYNDSQCRTLMSPLQITFTPGTSTKQFFYRNPAQVGIVTVQISEAGFNTYNENINIASPRLPWGNGFDGDALNLTSSSNVFDVSTDNVFIPGKTLSASRKLTGIDITRKVLNLTAFSNPMDFQTGDEILWIVVGEGWPGACDPGGSLGPGDFGFAFINGIIGNQITLDRPVTMTGGGNPSTALNSGSSAQGGSWCKIQVDRVPNFRNISIANSETVMWQVSTFDIASGVGGVFPFRVKGTFDITTGATMMINAYSSGYAGGWTQEMSAPTGGDSYTGQGFFDGSLLPPYNSTGASNSTSQWFGGGGGSNAGSGYWPDGSDLAYTYSLGCNGATCSHTKLFMGGGGGGGWWDSGQSGNGGGIIVGMIFDLTHSFGSMLDITAMGSQGVAPSSQSSKSAGGGGAGGTVWLHMKNSDVESLYVSVKGGDGGDDFNCSMAVQSGGGAGGGYLHFVVDGSHNSADNLINFPGAGGCSTGDDGEAGVIDFTP